MFTQTSGSDKAGSNPFVVEEAAGVPPKDSAASEDKPIDSAAEKGASEAKAVPPTAGALPGRAPSHFTGIIPPPSPDDQKATDGTMPPPQAGSGPTTSPMKSSVNSKHVQHQTPPEASTSSTKKKKKSKWTPPLGPSPYAFASPHHPYPPPPPGYGSPMGYPPPHFARPMPPPGMEGMPPPPMYWHPPPPPPPHHIAAPHHVGPPPPAATPSSALLLPKAKPNAAAKAAARAAERDKATSPSQIENSHRTEVQHMGCTCKRTNCLKLYCQCFSVKLHCSDNCRCLTCYNNAGHDELRTEAMRVILLRNPHAFDTKFRKNSTPPTALPMVGPVTVVAAVNKAAGTTTAPPGSDEPVKFIAHKTGCKCRRSACMKKYCECYAGSVSCGGNCRCVGCKNLPGAKEGFRRPTTLPPPPLHFGSPPRMMPPPGHYDPWMYSRPHPPPPYPHLMMSASKAPSSGASKESPPQAAASAGKEGEAASASEGKTSAVEIIGPNNSMPSLASSEGTSPGDRKFETTEGMSSLVLAAYAMTEIGQGSKQPPAKKAKTEKDA